MAWPKLFRKDCFKLMATMPDSYCDLILSDPPYGTTNISWDKMPDLPVMWSHFKRVLKPNGLIILTANEPFTSYLITSNIEWFKYDLVWDKNKCGSPGLAKIRPMRVHENIVIFSGTTGTKSVYNPQMEKGDPYYRKQNGRQRCNHHGYGFKNDGEIKNEGTRYPKSILRISRDFSAQQQVHPTQKPVPMLEWLIKTYSNKGDIVFDPYMGSGSTGVAAINLERKFIGVEKRKDFFGIANERCNEALAKFKPKLFG